MERRAFVCLCRYFRPSEAQNSLYIFKTTRNVMNAYCALRGSVELSLHIYCLERTTSEACLNLDQSNVCGLVLLWLDVMHVSMRDSRQTGRATLCDSCLPTMIYGLLGVNISVKKHQCVCERTPANPSEK